MRKIAFFVEGLTEQLFVEKLLLEIAGKSQVAIETAKFSGGNKLQRTLRIIQGTSAKDSKKFYASIVDCGGDSRVKSDILDRYENLIASGFNFIVGIKDVYPEFEFSQIDKHRMGLKYRMPTRPIDVVFVLGIMEIESWFIMECSHFPKIDPKLNAGFIKSQLNLDPQNEDIQCRSNPSGDLKRIYNLVGLGYSKTMQQIQRTVNALDYEKIYLEVSPRIPDLSVLIRTIDCFLSK